MFTPPQSPLPPVPPPTKEESRPSSEEDEEEESQSEFEYTPRLPGVHPPTPTLARPPSKLSRAPLLSPSFSRLAPSGKSSRRRWVIPLLAVILVLVAAASRLSPTRRIAELWEDPPSAVHVQPHPPTPHKRHHQPPTRRSHRPDKTRRQGSLASFGAIADRLPTPSGILATTSTNSTPPSIPDPPYPVPTPFPQAFDTTFSYNFSTSSCQSFFANSLLANTTFRKCRAFSLLLPSSSQFFSAQMNLTQLTAIVGGTCNTTPTVDDCVETMSWMVQEVKKDTVCGKDLNDRNAIVLSALNGFMNYEFMRKAGCLINQRTNSYCFVDAVAAFPPSDIYFYNLPLGTPLPNSTTPTCSTCTESLLNIYAQQASNSKLDISKTYPGAAKKAVAVCGTKYAQVLSTSGSVRTTTAALWWSTVLGIALLLVTLGAL